MPLRDTKDMKLIEVGEPLTLRDEERFHNGPRVFYLKNQGDGGTTYTNKSVCVGGWLGGGVMQELVPTPFISRS